MVAMHFLISIAFLGDEEEGINSLKFGLLSRFLEPWAFVAAGGVIAPGRAFPCVILAIGITVLHLTVPVIYLVGGGPALTTGIALLRAATGITGGVAGVISVLRYKTNLTPASEVQVKNDQHEQTASDERRGKQIESDIVTERGNDSVMRGAAADRVGEIHQAIADLRNKDSAARAAAADRLGEMHSGLALEPLIGVLKDEDPRVRTIAAWALGRINDSRATSALSIALQDPDEKVRREVSVALQRITKTDQNRNPNPRDLHLMLSENPKFATTLTSVLARQSTRKPDFGEPYILMSECWGLGSFVFQQCGLLGRLFASTPIEFIRVLSAKEGGEKTALEFLSSAVSEDVVPYTEKAKSFLDLVLLSERARLQSSEGLSAFCLKYGPSKLP
jgi:hypothetical protein